MEFYILEQRRRPRSRVLQETFNGSHKIVPLYCCGARVRDEEESPTISVIRSAHFFPPIFGFMKLFVNEEVKEKLKVFSNIRCRPIKFSRLVDLYFNKDDDSWDNETISPLLLDSFFFMETIKEVSVSESKIPAYYAVQCYSTKVDESIDVLGQEIELPPWSEVHKRGQIRIGPRDVQERGMLDVSFGQIMSPEFFAVIAPYLDADVYAVWLGKDGNYNEWTEPRGEKVVWPKIRGRIRIPLLTRLKWRFFPED